jgi:hypothetical protein
MKINGYTVYQDYNIESEILVVEEDGATQYVYDNEEDDEYNEEDDEEI